MVEVAVEVIKPFVHAYPVTGDVGDYIEERYVPGKDGHPVKRPVAFKRIEGTVEFAREDGKGQREIITHGTGVMKLPKEVADTLIARGVVRAVGAPGPVPEEDVPEIVRRPPRNRLAPVEKAAD